MMKRMQYFTKKLQKTWNKVYEFYGPPLFYDFLLHFVLFDVYKVPVPIYCYCTEKKNITFP